MAMKLSTGKIAFPIEFDNGDKQNIYFNPNDPNLSLRLVDFQDKIKVRLKEIEELTVEKENEESVLDTIKKVHDMICEEINIAFGGDISSVVFKYCSPFAIVGGEYYIIQFLEAIKPEIEKHIKKANADIEKKMAKHIGKYSK